jgi:hypothetical protein
VFRRLLLCVVLAASVLVTAQASPATSVHLRVEGLTTTLFDGLVDTVPHVVKAHPCDGTNGGASPAPGPTMTGALDSSGLSWDGTWFPSFEDFSVDRIGSDASDNVNFRFWGLVLNFKQTDVGGCQQQVKAGDEVLFAYDLFSKAHVLKLSVEPAAAPVGSTLTFTVVDGQNGSPVAGAAVGGAASGADGIASLLATGPGTHTFKADKSDSVRSNAVSVCVYDPALGGCGVPAVGPTALPAPAATSTAEPPTASEGAATPPQSAPACSEIAVGHGRLQVGKRARLRIAVRRSGEPDELAIVRIRGVGVNLRRSTNGDGVATATVLLRGGPIRVGVRGQIGRCGEERITISG